MDYLCRNFQIDCNHVFCNFNSLFESIPITKILSFIFIFGKGNNCHIPYFEFPSLECFLQFLENSENKIEIVSYKTHCRCGELLYFNEQEK